MKPIYLLLFFVLILTTLCYAFNEGLATTVGFGTTNLYSYWTFDVNTTADYGGYTATSQSVTAYNATNSIIGSSAYFDGVNDFINYTTKTEFPNKPITILWWARYGTASNNGYMWGDVNLSTGGAYAFARQALPNYFDGGFWKQSLSTYISWGSTSPIISTNVTQIGLSMTNWQMYGLSLTSTGRARTFVNGNNSNGPSINLSDYNGIQSSMMLGNRPALDRDFIGWVDEFMTFNTNLSVFQVSQIYNDSFLYGVRPYDNLSTVTALSTPSLTNSSIYITWTNPTDRVFNKTTLYYNSTTISALTFISNETGTSKNITGLSANTTYSIYIYSIADNNKNTTVGAYIINTTLTSDSCTCTTTNCNYLCSDNCVIGNKNFNKGNVTIIGTGRFKGNLTNYYNLKVQGSCNAWIGY